MTTKITEQNVSNLANVGVDWQSPITADGSTVTTAVAGRGYFIDTTSAAHTINLPASTSVTIGDTISIVQINGSNAVTIGRNGNKINGATDNGTLNSDGDATLEQMADAARNIGWNWLGIADHSPTLKVANGASAEDLLAQGRQIKQYNEAWSNDGVDFRLFHGVESDILDGGKLDHPDDVLGELDYVVASVHAMTKWKNRDEVTNTEELIRCIDHPATTVLGHPTGRILQGRDGYEVDMFAVIEHMAEHNEAGRLKAVELNASPYRLDLDWRLCKYAKTNNVPVVINPDAHSIRGLGDVAYGVMTARKGWLESDDILNSLSGEAMTARLS